MRILAADIGGTTTKLAICNKQGHVDGYKEYETESKKGGPYVVEKLVNQLSQIHREDYDVIAISTAGQVDAINGKIVYANENIPNYTGMELASIISDKLNKSVKIENDVNAAALGEMTFGAAKHYQDFLSLTYGTGIGGAIVIDRQLYKGANGVAGEFGHMLIPHISNRNLLHTLPYYEHYASTLSLIKSAQMIDSDCINGRILFQKINQGRDEFIPVLNMWVDNISAGLISLVHIFNPAAIIIGGGIMEQDVLIEMISQRVQKRVMPSFSQVKVTGATLGNKAGLLGASSLWL